MTRGPREGARWARRPPPPRPRHGPPRGAHAAASRTRSSASRKRRRCLCTLAPAPLRRRTLQRCAQVTRAQQQRRSGSRERRQSGRGAADGRVAGSSVHSLNRGAAFPAGQVRRLMTVGRPQQPCRRWQRFARDNTAAFASTSSYSQDASDDHVIPPPTPYTTRAEPPVPCGTHPTSTQAQDSCSTMVRIPTLNSADPSGATKPMAPQ